MLSLLTLTGGKFLQPFEVVVDHDLERGDHTIGLEGRVIINSVMLGSHDVMKWSKDSGELEQRVKEKL